MILVVDVCSDRLGYFEFVKPVEDILKKAGVGFLTRGFLAVNHGDIASTEKTVICGTALKDFGYLDNIDRFTWITKTRMPILGICAGMQIIAMLFNSDIIERTRIGRYRVKTVLRDRLSSKDEFYSYFLNSKAVEPSEDFETLCKSGDLCCMIKHRRERFFGCLFHPEVLNPEIITNFTKDGAQFDDV
jgi:imidazoleglycerol phosphate synthase glutamine amidotransferase subunit HisH